MSYQMSWEKTRIDPLEFIQEQNNQFEMNNDFDFDFVDVGDFDPDEIL